MTDSKIETTAARTKGALPQSEKPTPATVHSFARRMKDQCALPRKLRSGTFAVRNDESLLPKSPAESNDGYKLRMARTFLLGSYEEASDRLKATVFSGGVALEPPEEETQHQEETGKGQPDDAPDRPKPEVDPRVEAWARDFDNEHRTLLDWLMDALEEGLDCGLVHALADHPVMGEPAETLEDEIRSGARPYAVLLHGDTLIQKDTVRRSSGQLVPLRLNFERVVRKTNGYAEVEKKVILELHAGDPSVEDTSVGSLRFAHWKEFEVDKDGKVSETPIQTGSYRPHVEIPIRTCYFRRTGFLEARPAMQALAEKVAEHLQSSSHQRFNLDFARHTRTFRKGFSDEEKKQTKTGASAIYSAGAAHADMKVVETTGAALGAGRQHLEDCKAEIQLLGFKPYVKLTAVTAAEAAINKDDASNLAVAWAYNLEAFAQELLDLFVAWQTPVGKDPKRAALVKVNPDESLILSPQQLDFLKLLIKDLDLLDEETTLRIAKELGTLPEWVDITVVLDRLRARPPKLVGMPLPFGQPPARAEAQPPEGEQAGA